MESTGIVFDSYAILAFIEDEENVDIVGNLIADQKKEKYLSFLNLGEIYYIIERRHGTDAAEEVVDLIFLDDSITLCDVSWPRIKDAAHFKAGGGLSYADSFVLGLATELKVPVITGDPEIENTANKMGIKIIRV